jgi:hypothetical protein
MNTRRIRVAGKWRGEKRVMIQNDLSDPIIHKRLKIGKKRQIHTNDELVDAFANDSTQDHVIIDVLRITAYRERRVQQFTVNDVEFTINMYSQREAMMSAIKKLRAVKNAPEEVTGVGFCFKDVSVEMCGQCHRNKASAVAQECPDPYLLKDEEATICYCCEECRQNCAIPF